MFEQTPNNIFIDTYSAKRTNEYLLDEILEMKDAGFKYQRFNVGMSEKGNNDLADRIFSDTLDCETNDIPILVGRDINCYIYDETPPIPTSTKWSINYMGYPPKKLQ